MRERVTTAGWQVSWLAGLSPPITFPGTRDVPSGIYDRQLAAYSCGGSYGIAPR